MTDVAVKEKILKVMNEMPQDVSYEDIIEKIYFLYKVEKGIQQADKGDKVSHDEAKKRLNKWLE